MQNNPSLIFFGTSDYSVIVLNKLIESGFTPKLVVTTPDKPAGKGLVMTPSPVKVFAREKNLEIFQPEKLKNPDVIEKIKSYNPNVGVVVAYGKIIPQDIIDLFPHGLLNVHASLLPKLRGASPIETAILNDEKKTGVTIMLVDAEMDHGPIVAQQEVLVEPWPPEALTLGTNIVETGASLLVETLPQWLSGSIKAQEQDHTTATYTRKIEKADGLIDLADDPYQNFLKIQAFHEWPTTYFFVERNGKKIRVIIKKAAYTDGHLEILRIVPEGKKEMNYEDFKRSLS